MASPKASSTAVLISVRKKAACHGLGTEHPQLPFRSLVSLSGNRHCMWGKLLYVTVFGRLSLITFIDKSIDEP